MLVKNRDYRLPSWKDVCEMCLAVEQGISFKPRKGPASSLHIDLSEQTLAQADAEEPREEPAALMHVPEPKKRVFHFFKGGGKRKREPQIQIDPNSGKKILRKPKTVNAGFKVIKPIDW